MTDRGRAGRFAVPEAAIDRDAYGRPKIIDPGGHPRRYTRATTIAGTNDARYALERWQQRNVAIGLGRRPDLYAVAQTVDPGERDKLDRICSDAIEAAGGSERRNLGDALHALTADLDLGRIDRVPEQFAAEIAAYRSTVGEVVWDLVETMVVLDGPRVAGTPDRVGTIRSGGSRQIVDLKTGAELSYSWGSIAIQLAIYANADAIYDAESGTRHDLGEIDRRRGVVIHLPVGEGRCQLYSVDLVAGWEGFALAMEVRDWRKRRGLAEEIEREASRGIEEGALEDPEVVQHLAYAVGQLDAAARSWIARLSTEAEEAGVSFRLRGSATAAVTERRIRIMSALIVLGRSGLDYDDAIRGLVEEILGDVAQFGNVSPGALLGALGAPEAGRLVLEAERLSGVPEAS